MKLSIGVDLLLNQLHRWRTIAAVNGCMTFWKKLPERALSFDEVSRYKKVFILPINGSTSLTK